MRRPKNLRFDNPQDYPEDEDKAMAPGSPPHEGREPNLDDLMAEARVRALRAERRARRLSEIDDHLRTRESRAEFKSRNAHREG